MTMRTSRTLTAALLGVLLALTGCTGGSTEAETQTTAAPVEQPVLPVALPDLTRLKIDTAWGAGLMLWLTVSEGTEVVAPVTATVLGAASSGSAYGSGYVTLTTADGKRIFISGVEPTVAEGEEVEQGTLIGTAQPKTGVTFEVHDDAATDWLDPRVWLAGE